MKSTLLFSIMALATVPSVLAGIPGCYSLDKKVAFTQYWISKEGTEDMDNNGNIMHLTGPRDTPLKDTKGKTIAMVAKTTFEKCQMEGTCLLEDGKLVNLDNGKSAFKVLDRKKEPYGEGYAPGVALDPFVTIATNDLPHKATVYIKELDGLHLPNGKTHNGCVRVEDDSWSFNGCHIDWFVLEYPFYVTINAPENVHSEVRSCEILDYITPSIEAWGLLGKSITTLPPVNGTATGGKKGKGKKGKGKKHRRNN
ncbi:hypothetical protein BC937DRAFT_91176 [Endogone sp. FLAS-F59071]|nr:hypothetical protein BC937DRAFT_91176 [Endogone sp. FLAS-F59071]|eukprot:RUS16460.1 hypothetical protein BC937DRAFT_91176 [Endogone sp. FLAS-F59071]